MPEFIHHFLYWIHGSGLVTTSLTVGAMFFVLFVFLAALGGILKLKLRLKLILISFSFLIPLLVFLFSLLLPISYKTFENYITSIDSNDFQQCVLNMTIETPDYKTITYFDLRSIDMICSTNLKFDSTLKIKELSRLNLIDNPLTKTSRKLSLLEEPVIIINEPTIEEPIEQFPLFSADEYEEQQVNDSQNVGDLIDQKLFEDNIEE